MKPTRAWLIGLLLVAGTLIVAPAALQADHCRGYRWHSPRSSFYRGYYATPFTYRGYYSNRPYFYDRSYYGRSYYGRSYTGRYYGYPYYSRPGLRIYAY